MTDKKATKRTQKNRLKVKNEDGTRIFPLELEGDVEAVELLTLSGGGIESNAVST